jgi:hypothetical protein
MSIAELYVEKRTAFAPPVTQTTYEQFVFNMERTGTNDLVTRDKVDPTFRPPLASDSYQAQKFQEGLNQNLSQ